MKKILTFLFAMVMFMTVANAQTIKNDGVFSHMYLGIKGGAVHNPVSNYDNFEFKNLDWNGALEPGKDVTPITGFSLEGICNPDFENGFKVDRVDVFGNAKFNLMNLFGGYKGYPRRVEIKIVTGIGWNHYFDNTAEAERIVENPNDIALQAGLEFDFNLGKNRNWYITFSPMVQANQILKGNEIEFVAKGADLTANLGVAYRFGHSNKSHNFEICDKAYTEQQYADLYALYDECMNRPAKVDTVTVTVKKYVEKYVEVVKNNELSNAVIVFAKNSSELTEAETHRLDIIMGGLDKEGTYMVVGSADSATGTETYNKELAQKRADTVAEIMNKNGFNNVETAIQIDAFKDQEITRCAIIRVKLK